MVGPIARGFDKLTAGGPGFAFGSAEASQFLIFGLKMTPGERTFVVNVIVAVGHVTPSAGVRRSRICSQ